MSSPSFNINSIIDRVDVVILGGVFDVKNTQNNRITGVLPACNFRKNQLGIIGSMQNV